MTGSIIARQTLESAPSQLAAFTAEHRARLARIEKAAGRTDKWKREEKNKVREESLAALSDFVTKTEGYKNTVIEHATSKRNKDGSETARLAKILEDQQLWQRYKSLLDSGMDWAVLINQAAGEKDINALGVLRAELPTYIQAKTKTGDADSFQRALNAALDKAEYPLLTPDQQLARDTAIEVERGMGFLNTAVAYVREELTTGTPYNVLPDWSGGVVKIGDTPQAVGFAI